MAMPTQAKCTHPSDMSSPPDDKADPKPTLEQLFSEYPIQTSIMQHLNFYDFRNLRLTGCQVTATSWAIQKKYLVPINCEEFRASYYDDDSDSECGNAPQNVEVMKPCQGLSLRPDDPKIPLFRPYFHDDSDQSKCFWVCDRCMGESESFLDQHDPLDNDPFRINFTQLCEMHSLELQGFPENACHCCRNALGEWRCSSCIERSLQLIQNRVFKAFRAMPSQVTLLGIWSFIVRPHVDRWTDWLLRRLIKPQEVINRYIPWRFFSMLGLRHRKLDLVKWSRLCPIENCRRVQWKNTPSIALAMWMCLECKAVFSGGNARYSPLSLRDPW